MTCTSYFDHTETAADIVLEASDGSELQVDRSLLVTHSHVLGDLLASCDAGRLKLQEGRQALQDTIVIANGMPLPDTFSEPIHRGHFITYNDRVYGSYGAVLEVAHKYDMPLVKERCEKWLLSRLFRVKSSLPDNTFHWLNLCRLYGLPELGHHITTGFGKSFTASRFRQELVERVNNAPDDESISLADLKAILRAVPQ